MTPAEQIEALQKQGLSRLAIAEHLDLHDDDIKLILMLPDELRDTYYEEAKRNRTKAA